MVRRTHTSPRNSINGRLISASSEAATTAAASNGGHAACSVHEAYCILHVSPLSDHTVGQRDSMHRTATAVPVCPSALVGSAVDSDGDCISSGQRWWLDQQWTVTKAAYIPTPVNSAMFVQTVDSTSAVAGCILKPARKVVQHLSMQHR